MSFYELVHFQALALQLRDIKQRYGMIKAPDIYYDIQDVVDELEEMIASEMKKKREESPIGS